MGRKDAGVSNETIHRDALVSLAIVPYRAIFPQWADNVPYSCAIVFVVLSPHTSQITSTTCSVGTMESANKYPTNKNENFSHLISMGYQ